MAFSKKAMVKRLREQGLSNPDAYALAEHLKENNMVTHKLKHVQGCNTVAREWLQGVPGFDKDGKPTGQMIIRKFRWCPVCDQGYHCSGREEIVDEHNLIVQPGLIQQ